jgi:hypothetical protein
LRRFFCRAAYCMTKRLALGDDSFVGADPQQKYLEVLDRLAADHSCCPPVS